MSDPVLPRLALQRVQRALRKAPVVLLSGARATGKTTLCQELIREAPRRYLTLSDDRFRDIARREERSLANGDPLVLEDLEREPRLLRAIAQGVGRRAAPGRVLLTSSAHLEMLPRIRERLPGRAQSVRVWPLTRREARGGGTCGRWGRLAEAPEREWMDALTVTNGNAQKAEDWRALARLGGFPAAQRLRRPRDRKRWFQGYVNEFLSEDLRRLSAASSTPSFRRLMRAAALRLGRVVNQTSLGRAVKTPQPTVRRRLGLLEAAGLLVKVPAWTRRGAKRLTKSPRLYWSDTGLAIHLADEARLGEPHLRNLLLMDLMAWRDGADDAIEVFHWRTTTDAEVDFVIETSKGLIPVEVTTASSPTPENITQLRTFRGECPDQARAGLALHTGAETGWVADGVLGLPWWRIL